jgi:hypothetical protein
MNAKKAQDGSFDLDWLRYISREKAKYGFAQRTYIVYCFIILLHSLLGLWKCQEISVKQIFFFIPFVQLEKSSSLVIYVFYHLELF